MRLKADSIRILADALIGIRRRKKCSTDTNLVVIVNGGMIGDSILFHDALSAMTRHFKAQGKQTIMICRPAVKSFLTSVCPELDTIAYFEIAFDRFVTDFTYYKEIAERLKTLAAPLLIAPQPSKFADFIALNIPAKQKLQVKPSSRTRCRSPYEWLNRISYNTVIPVDTTLMALERYAVLPRKIGIASFQSKIAPFLQRKTVANFSAYSPYCVVAPTASEEPRCWGLEKFCAVIAHIMKKTDWSICISAGREGEGFFERICVGVPSPERLIDCIGKTDFVQWVELIRHAEFCFGNDSAAIHIAAHTGTPSIAVTPGVDYQDCQPYRYEQKSEGDMVPVCLYAYKNCFGCYHKNLKRCAGNPACGENVKRGGKYLCIRDISAEQAIAAVDQLLPETAKRRFDDEGTD